MPAGRQFTTAADLNDFIKRTNAAGGIGGTLLPLVSNDARFRQLQFARRTTVPDVCRACGRDWKLMAEVFNLFQHHQRPRRLERQLLQASATC